MASDVAATERDRRRQGASTSLSAALSRSFASSLSFYFSRPIRLFRPTKVSAVTAIQALALDRGQSSLSPSVLRSIIREEGGWRFFPRHVLPPFLVNTLFGATLPSPLVIAPIAAQSLWHADAECGTARAAGALGIPVILSGASFITFSRADIVSFSNLGAILS